MCLSKLVSHCDKRIDGIWSFRAWYSSIQNEMTIPLKPTRVSNSPGSNWSGLDPKEMSFIIRELCQKHSIPVAVFCIGNWLFRIQSIWSFGVLIDRQYFFFLPANSVVPAGKLSWQNFHISTEEWEHELCLGNYLAIASVCGGQWKVMTPELQCAWRVSNLSGLAQNQVVEITWISQMLWTYVWPKYGILKFQQVLKYILRVFSSWGRSVGYTTVCHPSIYGTAVCG